MLISAYFNININLIIFLIIPCVSSVVCIEEDEKESGFKRKTPYWGLLIWNDLFPDVTNVCRADLLSRCFCMSRGSVKEYKWRRLRNQTSSFSSSGRSCRLGSCSFGKVCFHLPVLNLMLVHWTVIDSSVDEWTLHDIFQSEQSKVWITCFVGHKRSWQVCLKM